MDREWTKKEEAWIVVRVIHLSQKLKFESKLTEDRSWGMGKPRLMKFELTIFELYMDPIPTLA